MKEYLQLMNKVLIEGTSKSDRTGIGTRSIFGYQMRFDLQKGFPLVTTKLCHIKSIIYELLWFLKGDTNIAWLNQHHISIWDEWADDQGSLGPIYGKQWRCWETTQGDTIDQISQVIKQIKQEPNSRRLIVSAWNVGELHLMSLAPCHVLFQFYILDKKISCQVYQRSCDIFLGLPFNIASYAVLLKIFAHQCNLEVGELIWTGGDIHLYSNHVEQAKIQMTRIPHALPKLIIKRKPSSIFGYLFSDFQIIGYDPYPKLAAQVAI
ncbi:MAG: thymidylate synthase [Candidatus Dasytiphilus stammeri]